MIKVNLIGASRKKAKAGFKLTLPSSSTDNASRRSIGTRDATEVARRWP